MIDYLIIVAENEPVQMTLAAHLRHYRQALGTIPVFRREDLDRLSLRDLSRARIVGFCTDIVVPGRILDTVGFGAYNFHPGPPCYPGWAPASFAIHDGARRYGATAHVMAPKVDTGAIVGTNMFDIPATVTLPDLEDLACRAALHLFFHLAPHLAMTEAPLPPIPVEWGTRRCTKGALKAMCDVSLDLSGEALTRRIRAFGTGRLSMRPGVRLDAGVGRAGSP